MQTRKLEELTSFIESRKAEVEIKILQKGRERSFRRRPRDPEEIEVLNQICLLRWRKAEEEGKIRYISKTQWYVVNYENIYRLCYIHGAEGILI